MAKPIKLELLKYDDHETINLIANWYLSEWKIPVEKTIVHLRSFDTNSEFQLLLKIDGVPIATAGLYHEVGLLAKMPELKIYKNWLALMYTVPEYRHQGYASLICKSVAGYAKDMGLRDIYLFTHSAESLYLKLNWKVLQHLQLNGKNIAIMKKEL